MLRPHSVFASTATTKTSTTMRSQVSAFASTPTPVPRFSPDARKPATSFSCGCKKLPLSSSRPSSVRASNDRSPRPARTLGCPEPPWLVLPPSPPENPFSGQPWPSDMEMKGVGGTEVPLSLRMVQMKKRLATAGPSWADFPPPVEGDGPAAVESSTGRAVSALVFMVGELQRAVIAGWDGGSVDESVLDRVSKDRRDSFVWLLRRVFFSSPNLVASLLLLLANYVALSAEKNGSADPAISTSIKNSDDKSEIAAYVAHDEEVRAVELKGRGVGSASGAIRTGDYLNWFDIGIKEGNLHPRQREDEETCVDRRRRVYERTIADGGANSLVLSNYAQFLYCVANDHDRAEQYFQWAVMAEPPDAEAMSRYAFFLWEVRGDISGAEEFFLEAIETEPGNHHHGSNYAWFLWKTGALDTCYPLDPPPLPQI